MEGMMQPVPDRPAAAVLEAFGLGDGSLSHLGGGEGRTWVANDTVLKPISDTEEAAWVADVMADLPEEGFRVSRPLRSVDGRWAVDGWSAWSRVAGEHDFVGRWHDVIEVGELFHAQLRSVPRPPFLDGRRNPWDAGDRAAWGEESAAVGSPELARLVERLQALLRPPRLASQLIHGDLPGNVLFADPLPPAVIDFSPYWRPAGFAAAIVVVDAIAWYGADETLLDSTRHIEDMDQLLARAAIYRIVTADRFAGSAGERYVEANVAAHEPLAVLVERLAGA
jgi:uncharacterized protein (TIGR02569 family)